MNIFIKTCFSILFIFIFLFLSGFVIIEILGEKDSSKKETAGSGVDTGASVFKFEDFQYTLTSSPNAFESESFKLFYPNSFSHLILSCILIAFCGIGALNYLEKDKAFK